MVSETVLEVLLFNSSRRVSLLDEALEEGGSVPESTFGPSVGSGGLSPPPRLLPLNLLALNNSKIRKDEDEIEANLTVSKDCSAVEVTSISLGCWIATGVSESLLVKILLPDVPFRLDSFS